MLINIQENTFPELRSAEGGCVRLDFCIINSLEEQDFLFIKRDGIQPTKPARFSNQQSDQGIIEAFEKLKSKDKKN